MSVTPEVVGKGKNKNKVPQYVIQSRFVMYFNVYSYSMQVLIQRKYNNIISKCITVTIIMKIKYWMRYCTDVLYVLNSC